MNESINQSVDGCLSKTRLGVDMTVRRTGSRPARFVELGNNSGFHNNKDFLEPLVTVSWKTLCLAVS